MRLGSEFRTKPLARHSTTPRSRRLQSLRTMMRVQSRPRMTKRQSQETSSSTLPVGSTATLISDQAPTSGSLRSGTRSSHQRSSPVLRLSSPSSTSTLLRSRRVTRSRCRPPNREWLMQLRSAVKLLSKLLARRRPPPRRRIKKRRNVRRPPRPMISLLAAPARWLQIWTPQRTSTCSSQLSSLPR